MNGVSAGSPKLKTLQISHAQSVFPQTALLVDLMLLAAAPKARNGFKETPNGRPSTAMTGHSQMAPSGFHSTPTSGLPQPKPAAVHVTMFEGPAREHGQRLGSFVVSHSQKKFQNCKCHLLWILQHTFAAT